MANDTQQLPTEAPSLLPDPSAAPELAGGLPPGGVPPGAAEMGMPGMEGGEALPGVDLDSLLAELDSYGAPQAEMPASAPQAPAAADAMAQAMEEAALPSREDDPFGAVDMTSQRVARLEQQLSGMQQKNAALERENERQSIHNTISEGIDKEMTSLGIDKEGKAGKGLVRLIANSVLVSVAQNQAVSGNQSVDPRTIKSTVKNWTKVFAIVAKEMASRQASETRLTSAGSQPAPYKVNKPLGELSENEFNDVVLANLRGGYKA